MTRTNAALLKTDTDNGGPIDLAPPGAPATSIVGILDRAVQVGMSAESLEKIMALYERVADREAAQEFAEAMSRFQAKCPSIRKGSTAKIATNSGASYSYHYAELDQIAAVIRPLLAEEGLSYTWDSTEDAGRVTCSCIIRHVNGHNVKASFVCGIDSAAKMSGAQRSASALTYARRQSLIQALGLTTCDPDNDGRGGGDPAEKISQHQADSLDSALENLGPDDRQRFLAYMKVDRLTDILARDFKRAANAIEAKRRAQK